MYTLDDAREDLARILCGPCDELKERCQRCGVTFCYWCSECEECSDWFEPFGTPTTARISYRPPAPSTGRRIPATTITTRKIPS